METDASQILIVAVVLAMGVHVYRYGVTPLFVISTGLACYMVLQARAFGSRGGPRGRGRGDDRRRPATGDGRRKGQDEGRYTQVDERVGPLIRGMRFTRRFEIGFHEEIRAITERFMRIYYNVLVNRFDARTNLDILRDLYEEMRALYERVPLVVPQFSNKFYEHGSRSLHDVVYAHLRPLLRIMRGKIKRVVERVRKKTELK